ncbi:TPA: hypothetical protein KLD84_000294 [Legionella pneumophila]|nr:hypothetical protein [Legionella pneumophila]
MKISISDPKDPKHETHTYTDKDFIIENNRILYLRTPHSHCIMTLEINAYDDNIIDYFTKDHVGRILEKHTYTHNKR